MNRIVLWIYSGWLKLGICLSLQALLLWYFYWQFLHSGRVIQIWLNNLVLLEKVLPLVAVFKLLVVIACLRCRSHHLRWVVSLFLICDVIWITNLWYVSRLLASDWLDSLVQSLRIDFWWRHLDFWLFGSFAFCVILTSTFLLLLRLLLFKCCLSLLCLLGICKSVKAADLVPSTQVLGLKSFWGIRSTELLLNLTGLVRTLTHAKGWCLHWWLSV